MSSRADENGGARCPVKSLSNAGVLAAPPLARDLLRRCTRSAHARLESHLGIMSRDLTLAEYRRTLQRLLAVHASLEPRIERHAPELARLGLVWEERRKVPLLVRDLMALEEREAARELVVAKDEPLDDFATVAHVIGALYVIEGSTLGGVVICRHVEKLLGLSRDNGSAFFHGYGPSTGARWTEFCAFLEQALVGDVARDAAVVAANSAFQMFVVSTGAIVR